MDKKYIKLASNTAIFAVGTFASKLLVLLLMPLYTSILSAEEYGVSDLISQTANLLIPLAAVGICDGIFRFAIDSEDKKGVLSTALSVLLAGSAVLVALSPIFSFIDFYDGYAWLICAYVICANIHSALAQYIRATGRSVMFAAQGTINTALTIVYNIFFLIVFDMGVTGYVLSVVVSDLTVSLVIFVWAKLWRDISPKRVSRACMRDMLKFSIPYIPTTILWLITSISDRFVVTYFCGEGINGLYSAAYKIPTLLIIACGIFIEAWQISAVGDGGDDEQKKDFFDKVYANYLSLMVTGAAFLIAGSKIFTKILLADSYFSSWEYIPMLSVAMMFSSLVSFMGSVYFLEKKSVFSMLTAMAGALVNIVLNFVLIPKMGAVGAAIATLISYVTVYVVRVIDTRRYLRFNTHNIKLLINTALLLIETAVLSSGIKYADYIAATIFLFVAIINLKGIVESVVRILKKFLKKSKKN